MLARMLEEANVRLEREDRRGDASRVQRVDISDLRSKEEVDEKAVTCTD